MMTQGVVDALESIKIQVDNRCFVNICTCILHLTVKRGPVRKSSQFVVICPVMEIVLQCLAIPDVTNMDNDPVDVRVIEQVLDGRLDIDPGPISVQKPEFVVLGDALPKIGTVENRFYMLLEDALHVLGKEFPERDRLEFA